MPTHHGEKRGKWLVTVEKRAEEPVRLEAFQPLTEASKRLVEETTGARISHATGQVEAGGVIYRVEVEADSLEEALERAGCAARAVEEYLLLYG